MKRYLKKVVFCTKHQHWQIDGGGQGGLYIVDTEQGLNLLKGMGLPVIAWLHEGNREQDLSAAAYAVESPQEVDMDFYEKVYRREMGISWEIVETERCLVREMIPEDAVAFESIYQNPEISRYMKDFHGSAEKEAQYIREYKQHYRFFEYGVWSIVLKSTGEVIGRVGFSEMEAGLSVMESDSAEGAGAETESDAEDNLNAEKAKLPYFGYMIGTPWQGQGLAYEVGRAVLGYAKDELGFEAVQLLVERSNKSSVRLAEKLGFVDDGSSCKVLRKVLSLK